MIQITTSKTKQDLQAILDLQFKNLKINLTPQEAQKQGYVTVHHTFEQLQQMNNRAQHVIAKINGKIIGYILAMRPQDRNLIQIIIPMFQVFDELQYKGKRISQYNYIVNGQTCIDKEYRKKGLFLNLLRTFQLIYSKNYQFFITQVASDNIASLKAHLKGGFIQIHRYAQNAVEWIVFLFPWDNKQKTS